MMQNLDVLRGEILEYLELNEFVVFHGHSRGLDDLPLVYWDVARHPDYRDFLRVARQAGSRLVVYHQREMTQDYIDDALERLTDSELPRDDQREMERRIRQLRAYEGFTCALELSFDHGGRCFLFDLRTEWFEELSDMLDEIDVATPDEDDEGPAPMGGYFSNN